MYYGMVKPVPIMLGEASGEEPIRLSLAIAPKHSEAPTHYVGEGAMQSHLVGRASQCTTQHNNGHG